MDNDKFARMVSKVKKILTKAEDPACTPQEAESLNEMAAKIIAQYGIEEALLARDDPNKKEKVVSLRMQFNEPYVNAKISLAHVIALAFRCQAIQLQSRDPENPRKIKKVLRVIGFASDVKRADFLYAHLLVQAITGLLMADLDKPDWENTKTWRNSWLHGFNLAIGTRLRAMEAKVVAETNNSTPGTALVVADRKSEIDAAFADLYPKTRSLKISTGGSGRNSGFHAGNQADIGHGRIGNSNKALVG